MFMSRALLFVILVMILSFSFLQSAFIKQSYAEPINISAFSLKNHKFNQDQKNLLLLAYSISIKDGHFSPLILPGIILQESNAGETDSVKESVKSRFYGVSQITLGAAKDVYKFFPKVFDKFNVNGKSNKDIIHTLSNNDEFNITIASKYLLVLREVYSVPETKLLAAYNQGAGGKNSEQGKKYTSMVNKKINNLIY